MGVSGIATELTLEQQAHNDGYDKMDIQGKCPMTQCCIEDRDKNCVLVSGINMERVCSTVNSANIKVKARVSHDPGRLVMFLITELSILLMCRHVCNSVIMSVIYVQVYA